eukprot:3408667-Prorocentrum_lima.AAC.1
MCVDVSITDPLTVTASELCLHARQAGSEARTRERRKHARYPGPGLCAGAMDVGGRFGCELDAFLRSHASE